VGVEWKMSGKVFFFLKEAKIDEQWQDGDEL